MNETDILEKDYLQKEGKKINLINIEFNQNILFLHIIFTIIWIFIFIFCKLYNYSLIINIIFFILIILRLSLIYIERKATISAINEQIKELKRTSEFAMIIFGTIILLLFIMIFKNDFNISLENRQNYIILVIINILLIFSIIGIPIENDSETISSLARFNRLCVNTAMWLLIVFIIKIYQDYK